MANHVLSLEVPDVMNACVLKMFDTSVYAPSMPVICPTLNITLPGFNYSVELPVTENFNLSITACDLNLQTTNCGTSYLNLPDGIYVIKYSVSPNEYVYVEYNHLRITQALIKWNELMCDLDISDCEPSTRTQSKLDQLRKIKLYLEAAKAKVETCHEPKKGMKIYDYAMLLLDKMNCKNC